MARMIRGAFAAGFLALLVAGLAAPAADAHEDPPGCTTGGLNFSFVPSSGLGIIHRSGDHLDIGVRISNNAAGACTVDDAAVNVKLPAPDGTPTGAQVAVASGASFPGGMVQTTLAPTAPYDIAFNPGVFVAPVTVEVSGTAHYPGGDSTGFIGSLSTPLGISRPHITLGVTPSLGSGAAPFPVTYTYTVTNDSQVDPNPAQPTPALAGPASYASIINDDICSPPLFTGGDTTITDPPLLQRGETWTFTCSHLFDVPGAFTNHAAIVGTSTRDGRDWPATAALSTVTATGPDLTVSKIHQGNFVAGGRGAYTLTATNSGNQPTTGTVTLKDALPAGLSATAISGAGWSCAVAALTCTRFDALAGGASYPTVTVTVGVSRNAGTEVRNVATVSGGGETVTANDSAEDPTSINRPSNAFSFGKVRRYPKRGTATLVVKVPGGGRLTLTGKGLKKTIGVTRSARSVNLPISPAGGARRRLNRSGKATIAARVKFVPTAGDPKSRTRVITLLQTRR